ncbi:hypothetical protein AALP_AA5G148700 [Arabis alpina]|uniref:Uncharacterized protein n=1 Tax=Arabis alpina TaxID=50452 RepID=A0A087GX61_ARAAL|nr:hypothetical protein AALP_AA5G148700 [Arabis alpina]
MDCSFFLAKIKDRKINNGISQTEFIMKPYEQDDNMNIIFVLVFHGVMEGLHQHWKDMKVAKQLFSNISNSSTCTSFHTSLHKPHTQHGNTL